MDSGPLVAQSINGIPIRLTDERWQHVAESHEDLADYQDDVLRVIEHPEAIFQGRGGSLIAVRNYQRRGLLAVFYRELSSDDGFIITARFLDSQPRTTKLWPKP